MLSESKKTPLISIILPAYNVEKYIDRAMESCVNQSYDNIEIIIVDDCGADDSILKSRSWAKKDSRIKVITSNKNNGTYNARRAGVISSKGDYIVFLDPDDCLMLDAISTIYNSISEQPADIIFFGYEEISSIRERNNILPISAGSRDEIMLNLFVNQKEVNYGTPGKAYRRSPLLNGYSLACVDEAKKLTYAEDLLLLYMVALNSERLKVINKYLYCYYKNPGTATTSYDPESSANKILQVDFVIGVIREVMLKKKYFSYFERSAANQLIDRLLVEKALAARYVKNSTGGSQYLSSVYRVWRLRRKYTDIARFFLYLMSFGIIRK